MKASNLTFLKIRYEIVKSVHFFRTPGTLCTLFPRIMVHALRYETEAIVHAPNESPISQIFGDEKNRSVSYLSACHCRKSET